MRKLWRQRDLAGVRSRRLHRAAQLVSLLTVHADAERMQGVILPEEAESVAHYLGKFCFDFDPRQGTRVGRLEVFLDHLPSTNSTSDRGWYFATYDDEDSHWWHARHVWASATCKQFLDLASGSSRLQTNSAEDANAADINMFITERLRPRFWYFVLLSCNPDVSWTEPVTYIVHATNLLRGSQSEFSMDQQGLLALHATATVQFAVLGAAQAYMAVRRFGYGAFRSRPLLTMLLWSCAGSSTGALCLTLHYTQFMKDGEGFLFLATLGGILLCLAKAILMTLQLVAAKGWGLLRSPQELFHRRLTTCLLVGIVFASIAVEIHGRFFNQRDWNTTLYFYSSWSGIVILLLNTCMSIVAFWSMLGACKQEGSPDVRSFNLMIILVSMLYFLTLPVICTLATVLAPWVRRKVVAGTETASRFFVTMMLAWVLRPSRVDAMIDARMVVPERREQAVELADPISGQGEITPTQSNVSRHSEPPNVTATGSMRAGIPTATQQIRSAPPAVALQSVQPSQSAPRAQPLLQVAMPGSLEKGTHSSVENSVSSNEEAFH